MLFRRLCPGCQRLADPSGLCPGCRRHLAGQIPRRVDPPDPIGSVVALYGYDPVVRGLVVAAKNGGRRDLLRIWGRQLADGAAAAVGMTSDDVDVVTWVPSSRQGARARGYDQGRLLARAVGRALGCPVRRLLVRRPGPTRIGAGRARRLSGPDLRCPVPSPPRVLVVDDVLTTGASLASSGRALGWAGADVVVGLVVAAVEDGHRGPAPGRGPRRAEIGTLVRGPANGT